jgi:hypothetical protein
MDSKQLIKYAMIAVGAYILYNWLQSSGMWASWFGGTVAASNSFTDPTLLMNYCQANPAGTAIFTNSAGVASSATCAQWIAANSPVAPVQTTVAPIAVPTTAPIPVPTTGGGGAGMQALNGWVM